MNQPLYFRILVMKRVLLILCILAYASAQREDCTTPTQGWFGVCDFSRRECVITDGFCSPYNSLRTLLTNGPGINPSNGKAWTILIDVYERNGTQFPSFKTNCEKNSNWGDSSECLTYLRPSTTGLNVKKWDFGTLIVRHSYITFKPLQNDNQQKVLIQKRLPVNMMKTTSLCRCMEFMGDHVHIANIVCDATLCVKFFRKSFQYKGDDGALLAFTGESAISSSVKECEFKSATRADLNAPASPAVDFRAFTTGIRFGADTADSAQEVDQVVLEENKFENLDFSIAFWNIATRFNGEGVEIKTINANCAAPFTGTACLVTYKQADPYAVQLYWNGTKDSTMPPDSELTKFALVNLSAVVPLSEAYAVPVTISPGFNDNGCRSNAEAVEIGLGISVGVLFIAVIVVIAREAGHRVSNPLIENAERDKEK